MTEVEQLTFTCPRCQQDVEEVYYGPCGSCREQLRASLGDDPGADVVAAEYEPKMNVTPNAVALKD
jgi:hypothetical protein